MPMSRILLVGGLVLACGQALAADLPGPDVRTVEAEAAAGQPGWSFAAASYFWAASMNGEIGQFGLPPVSVDASFSDILDHLDFAATMTTDLRYGDVGLFTDFVYVKLSGQQGTPLGILADSVAVDSKSVIFTAAGEYRLVDQPSGTLDLMAGARVWSVDTELSFHGGVLDGRAASDGDTWTDALAGLKGRLNLTPEIYLSGWAMGGGGSSDYMWDLWGGVGYQFNDQVSAVIGYRGTGVDYDNGEGFLFDAVQQGPVIGAVVRF